MLEKLHAIKERYEKLNQELSAPDIVSDLERFRRVSVEHANLSETVRLINLYEECREELAEARVMLAEEGQGEMYDMLSEEIAALEEREIELEEDIKKELLPKDPNDQKNVVMEIRAGAGGSEAALFASDLYRMYSRFAERQNWKTEVMDLSDTGIGGIKQVTFVIEGKGAYSKLKYESGVHRVQRIPTTEAGGRIHTSTATVAVLPEAEEVDIHIDPNDIRVDIFCASGPGGQSVNTTYSAVRLTHLPTNTVVSIQDEKSQIKNREKAMRVLRSRLLDMEIAKQEAELASERRSQVGTGDRSERIRTYNFPQSRVTDHRINLTLHQLDQILDGGIDELIVALATEDQAARLSKVE